MEAELIIKSSEKQIVERHSELLRAFNNPDAPDREGILNELGLIEIELKNRGFYPGWSQDENTEVIQAESFAVPPLTVPESSKGRKKTIM